MFVLKSGAKSQSTFKIIVFKNTISRYSLSVLLFDSNSNDTLE